MSSLRLPGFITLLVATLAPAFFAAENAPRLLPAVSADTAALIHVRRVADVREQFGRSPYARLWAEPEVQAFFAPTVAYLNSPEAQAAFGQFTDISGLAPMEFVNLFNGEIVFSAGVTVDGEGEPSPQFVFGGDLGQNREKFETAVKKAAASEKATATGSIEQEELQGETIHTFMASQEDDEPKETVSWAIVDDVVWMGYPKAAVQGMVANFKQGSATEPVTAAANFAPVYGRNPSAIAVYYIDLEGVVRTGLSAYQAHAAAKQLAEENAEDEDAEPMPPSQMEQMGITPDVIIHALGLDALKALYMVSLGGDDMVIETGLTWSEQRGLLKLLAFGDAPAPQPSFPAPDWSEVTVMRYKMSGFWEAIKDAARTANPMFEFMIAQQLAGLKQQAGLDVEQDFFGSFGDEAVVARKFLGDPTQGFNGAEQLMAASLTNAEAFTRALDTALAMVPNGSEMFEEREYLGHKIRSITAPLPSAGGTMNLLTVAFAVTPSHFFLGIGGTGMLETALQRLDGEGESYWAQPDVVAASNEIPGGSVGLSFQNSSEAIHLALAQLAQMVRASQASDEPAFDEEGRPLTPPSGTETKSKGPEQFVDPDSLPSLETLARHLGMTVSGMYLDADGFRAHIRYRNAP